MRFRRMIGVLLLALLFVPLAACTTNPKPPAKSNQLPANPPEQKVKVTLYFDAGDAYLGKVVREVPLNGKSVAERIVEELIAGPTEPGFHKTIPDGTKLLSLKVEDGIAYVNFSKEIQTNHWGGSAGENITAYSIVNSLTELPEIKKVQFLLEGEKVESIWGHGYTLEPLARDTGMVK